MAYTLDQVEERLKEFEKGIKAMWAETYKGHEWQIPVWTTTVGKKYIRVFSDTCVFAFIEIETGNVLKAASAAAPAKHARGNIFNENPCAGCNSYGPDYMYR